MDRLNRKIDVCGVFIDDISQNEAVDRVFSLAKLPKRGNAVVTVNSEFVMMARRDPKFKKVLSGAQLALPDGAWIVFLKRILGGKYQNRITGVDLVNFVCREASKKAVSIGFLGGFGRVADAVSKRQESSFRGLKIVFSEAGDPSIGYDSILRRRITSAGRIDILFVAFGMGKQEFWIERNRGKLNVGVFIGVGGAFDYISGFKKRAPIFMQKAGFEWFWRLISDPARIWRMRVLPAFFVLSLFFYFSKKFSKIQQKY